jgi:hypothetical protein
MAEELRAEVARKVSDGSVADRAGQVLEVCERARYAPNAPDVNANAARTVAENVRAIFEAGSRM